MDTLLLTCDKPFAIIGLLASLALLLVIFSYDDLNKDNDYVIGIIGFFLVCVIVPWMAKEKLIFSTISFILVGTLFKWLAVISYIHCKSGVKKVSAEEMSQRVYRTILKNRKYFNEKAKKI